MIENSYNQPCAVCRSMVNAGEGVCTPAKIETRYSWDALHHKCTNHYFDLLRPKQQETKQVIKIIEKPDRFETLLSF